MANRKRRVALAVGVGLVVCLGVAVTAWMSGGRAGMADDVAALRKMGCPTTIAEVKALEPRVNRDAGPLLAKFHSSEKKVSEAKNEFVDFSYYKLGPAKLQADVTITRQLADNLISASAMDGWKDGFAGPTMESSFLPADLDLRFEETAICNRAVRFLCGFGYAEAVGGRPEKAITDLNAAARLASMLGQKRSLIRGMVSCQADMRTLVTLKRILKLQNSAQVVKQALQLLNNLPPQPNLKQAIEAEAAYHLEMANAVENSPHVGPPVKLSSKIESALLEEPLARRQMAYEFHCLRIGIQSLPSDPTDFDGIETSLKRALKATPPNWLLRITASTDSRTGKTVDLSQLEVFAGCGEVWLDDLTARRMTAVDCELLEYRNAHGYFPKTLSALAQTPGDPFSHKPFGYCLRGDGFILYSVGRNRRDDGGVKVKGTLMEGDVVDDFSKLGAKQ